MKTVKFAASLVPLVISGEKNSTWRLFDDKDLSVGDDLEFVNKETGEIFGHAKILEVREKKLKDIQDEDFDGHEKFENNDAMIEQYKVYYGEKVSGETVVKLIKFSFHK